VSSTSKRLSGPRILGTGSQENPSGDTGESGRGANGTELHCNHNCTSLRKKNLKLLNNDIMPQVENSTPDFT
jgi:hypothetical protein